MGSLFAVDESGRARDRGLFAKSPPVRREVNVVVTNRGVDLGRSRNERQFPSCYAIRQRCRSYLKENHNVAVCTAEGAGWVMASVCAHDPEAWLTLAFGDAEWDADRARWTRPDRDDYESAERTFVIMRGRSDHPLPLSSPGGLKGEDNDK